MAEGAENRYRPHDIEAKWQERWEKEALFRRNDPPGPDKAYVIEMFAYPSGDLHWGHVRNYTIGDVYARYQAAKGRNVFHPFGFDAFGLPAENAAIKRGIHPAEWTLANIANMTSQLKRMGYAYDWSHTLNTCDPEYYRWNQWIFLKFLERGLAFKKRSFLNWCPQDKTVLANEQVTNGVCERCGTPVVKREMEQWFFRITDYADRLLENHAQLDWPQPVIEMQKNWIGRSTGARIDFELGAPFEGETISVFTTRPDTLFGVTYFVLAPEHPLVRRVMDAFPAEADRIQAFVEKVGRETEIERTAEDRPKEGIPLPIQVVNPANGEAVPVWIANYVLLEYGTGAVMAVPAHDTRDFAFAKQHGLPVREVIAPGAGRAGQDGDMAEAYTAPGFMVNSGQFDGTPSEEGKTAVTEWLAAKGKAEATVNYRLRDWCISRQRYWGTPIPIIYCDRCGTVPVPEEDLPVLLPTDVTFTGENPLTTSPSFVNTTCPKCGGAARRDTDTMDTFVDSSWYELRYLSPDCRTAPFDRGATCWMPLDMYVGGREHATMHLIYARFFTMALHDMGLVDFDEPFHRLFNQGILTQGGTKMSKRGNATPPNQLLDKYGADACRLFILFVAPPEERTEWNEAGVEGTFRFLTRVWRFVLSRPQVPGGQFAASDEPIRREVHSAIRKVTEDMEGMRYNTAIAAMMELVNALGNASLSDAAFTEASRALVLMLSPFAPHIACELWEKMGESGTLYASRWPAYDEALARAVQVEIVLQINGKVRDRFLLPAGTPAAELEKIAREHEKVRAALDGRQIRKVIAVPDKLVNVVIA
jgi:leucyl-tRNA synthetase